MGYAIKKDGSGWRAVLNAAAIAPDENFVTVRPDPIVSEA